ncbi:hypothetical protein AAC387_Pa06g0045 [Persea americana]
MTSIKSLSLPNFFLHSPTLTPKLSHHHPLRQHRRRGRETEGGRQQGESGRRQGKARRWFTYRCNIVSLNLFVAFCVYVCKGRLTCVISRSHFYCFQEVLHMVERPG